MGEVDEVVLLPERSPRDKPEATALSMRINQLEESIAPFPSLRVVSLASDRFTVDQTLPELRARFNDAELYLLIGSDIVSSLHAWENLDDLLSEVSLLVGMRGTDERTATEDRLKWIGQIQNVIIDYRLVETDHADVASSHIRSGNMMIDLGVIVK